MISSDVLLLAHLDSVHWLSWCACKICRICLGTFMISRPTLSCSHWWEMFTQNAVMTSFYVIATSRRTLRNSGPYRPWRESWIRLYYCSQLFIIFVALLTYQALSCIVASCQEDKTRHRLCCSARQCMYSCQYRFEYITCMHVVQLTDSVVCVANRSSRSCVLI